MCALIAISRGGSWGWTSPRVLVLAVTCVAAFTAWVLAESAAHAPMVDLAMLKVRGVWVANLIGACAGFGLFASFTFLPQMVQSPVSSGYGLGLTVTESGILLLPAAISSFFVALACTRLVSRTSLRFVVSTGTTAVAASYACVAVWHEEMWQLMASMALQGVGTGLVFASLAGLVIDSVPATQTGVATGMNANIRSIGGCIGVAVMAGLITAWTDDAAGPDEAGYVAGFIVLAMAMVPALAAAALIPSQRPSHDACLGR